VGIGTALADDPLLTARDADARRQPARVVFDSAARLPLDSALARSLDQAPLLVVVSPAASPDRLERLERAGADPVVVQGEGATAIGPALDELGRRQLTSLLLEGGPTLAGSFLDGGEVDELRLFIAPVVVGGSGARGVAEGRGAARIADAQRALATEWRQVGEDLLVRARLREW
jgi:diaminohydroxyphosphoribosylaminopyrimidine deaminase/5-amino-6-(5-phosphoribosylamino)uracil reductase